MSDPFLRGCGRVGVWALWQIRHFALICIGSRTTLTIVRFGFLLLYRSGVGYCCVCVG